MKTDAEVIDGRGEVFDEEGRGYYGRAYIHAVVHHVDLDTPASTHRDAEPSTFTQNPGRISFLNATHFAVPFELVGRRVTVQLEDGRTLKAVVEDTHGALRVKDIVRGG